jgi:hypothetical protein
LREVWMLLSLGSFLGIFNGFGYEIVEFFEFLEIFKNCNHGKVCKVF